MNRATFCLVAFLCCASASATAQADYTVIDKGTWPESWPKDLEPLRGQARTLEGPLVLLLHYAIPFGKREEFEAAWPHLLKVKTPGAPIVLRRGPSFWLGSDAKAGICIHTPPEGEAPVADAKEAGKNWQKTIYLELIVDGDIVDLNRLPLPADTPIIDERFDRTDQQLCRSGLTPDGTMPRCETGGVFYALYDPGLVLAHSACRLMVRLVDDLPGLCEGRERTQVSR